MMAGLPIKPAKYNKGEQMELDTLLITLRHSKEGYRNTSTCDLCDAPTGVNTAYIARHDICYDCAQKRQHRLTQANLQPIPTKLCSLCLEPFPKGNPNTPEVCPSCGHRTNAYYYGRGQAAFADWLKLHKKGGS